MRYLLPLFLIIGCKKLTEEEIKEMKASQEEKMRVQLENYFIKKNKESHEHIYKTNRTKEPEPAAKVISYYHFDTKGFIITRECKDCKFKNLYTSLDITNSSPGGANKPLTCLGKYYDYEKHVQSICGKNLDLPKEYLAEDKTMQLMVTFKWEKEKDEDEYEKKLTAKVFYVKEVLVFDKIPRVDVGTARKLLELGLFRNRTSYVCEMTFEFKDENIVAGAPKETLFKTWIEVEDKPDPNIKPNGAESQIRETINQAMQAFKTGDADAILALIDVDEKDKEKTKQELLTSITALQTIGEVEIEIEFHKIDIQDTVAKVDATVTLTVKLKDGTKTPPQKDRDTQELVQKNGKWLFKENLFAEKLPEIKPDEKKPEEPKTPE